MAIDTAATIDTPANDEGYDEPVLARAIAVQPVCEHHMLPFRGIARVRYLPAKRILGPSKLADRLHSHLRPTPTPSTTTGGRHG